jgi:transposase
MSAATGKRFQQAERSQLELVPTTLDELVPRNHRVRLIWDCLCKIVQDEFYEDIKATPTTPGRPPIDPKILLGLWVMATVEGIGSARHLAERCTRDNVYKWLCGGVSVNHHTLSDFRSQRGEQIDSLLTKTIAALLKAKLITLQTVAQDGMRVRAGAGAKSFHTKETLEECLQAAHAELKRLKEDAQQDETANARKQAAEERAAREQVAKFEAALAEMPTVLEERAALKDKKRTAKKGEPRVSTTDPEVRVIKMADGGFRPAVNVQLATDVESGCIVGLRVSTARVDAGEALPMMDDIQRRVGKLPGALLIDGGYSTADNIEQLTAMGTTPYTPPRAPRKEGVDPYSPRRGDSAAQLAWRARMKSEEGQQLYKLRASTAERVNADLRNRGLTRFTVRGIPKILGGAALFALTFNLLRMVQLMP